MRQSSWKSGLILKEISIDGNLFETLKKNLQKNTKNSTFFIKGANLMATFINNKI